jgi:hypothetical protein
MGWRHNEIQMMSYYHHTIGLHIHSVVSKSSHSRNLKAKSGRYIYIYIYIHIA